MGVVIQGEPSNRVALFNTIKNTTSIQNESLHRPSMHRSRLRWRRYVRHEENAKNMGRTQGYGIMLRREHDEDILAQNEKGSCQMHRNGHARARSSNVQQPTQIRSCFTRRCRRSQNNENVQSHVRSRWTTIPTTKPSLPNPTCPWSTTSSSR